MRPLAFETAQCQPMSRPIPPFVFSRERKNRETVWWLAFRCLVCPLAVLLPVCLSVWVVLSLFMFILLFLHWHELLVLFNLYRLCNW